MNPVQLYKELPKTNCRQCQYRTCMAFAVAVSKGDTELENCPFLDKNKVAELSASIKKVDWREDLIKSLQEEVKELDFNELAPGIGAAAEDDHISLTLFGRDFLIRHNGEITAEGPIKPWEKILILLYIKMQGREELTHNWVSFAELKGGFVKVEAIKKEGEKPLAQLLEKDAEKVISIFNRLGTDVSQEHKSERAWKFDFLPKIPVVIQYWEAVEDFPASVKMLFNPSAVNFLDIESLVFLAEGFVNAVDQMFETDNE